MQTCQYIAAEVVEGSWSLEKRWELEQGKGKFNMCGKKEKTQ